MIVQRGTSILGEQFIDIEVRSESGFVEARLQGGVLEISYMEGGDVDEGGLARAEDSLP